MPKKGTGPGAFANVPFRLLRAGVAGPGIAGIDCLPPEPAAGMAKRQGFGSFKMYLQGITDPVVRRAESPAAKIQRFLLAAGRGDGTAAVVEAETIGPGRHIDPFPGGRGERKKFIQAGPDAP